ncbi:MAG TPA: glucose-6-phosphate dehydrogenase [Candidatus Polarisedimenticolia bacterium]|jgi:glucose-6-phosphate 1-dehydrogenase|nr:glucose-6-phosphate dehydrogenase [Candidatus Polarisedimenticolia bacterium]
MADEAAPVAHAGDPCVMVIFGATGDLTKRKLIPALCNLARGESGKDSFLPRDFAIVGVATSDMTTEAFRKKLSEDINTFATGTVDPKIWEWLIGRVYFQSGDVKDPATYQRLRETVSRVERDHRTLGNVLFYLAVGPQFFCDIVRNLGGADLLWEETGWRRVVIEKPFGRDLESARALNAELRKVLAERQIYRIDHYLGKETVQNLLVFRFGNAIFEPIWDRRYIDHVQITAAETLGVEQRGRYYETAGALRDMVPSHLFQLVSLTAMEPPGSFDADAVRDEQSKVLRTIHRTTSDEIPYRAVRGQYGEGTIEGEKVSPYRTEPMVDPASNTETFAALRLSLDNWRWADVPFYLRTGKRMAQAVTEIAIQFRRVPFVLFRDTSVESLRTNRLVIRIQPQEGISLRFGAKIPGPVMRQGAVEMNFNYRDYFGSTPSTGYERLLLDCMSGDPTLFQRADMVEAGWSVITPILQAWSSHPPRHFPNYTAGSWGPKEAEEMMRRDGREWRKIE